MHSTRHLTRLADRIRCALEKNARSRPVIPFWPWCKLDNLLAEIERIRRSTETAHLRGWWSAFASLHEEQGRNLGTLRKQAGEVAESLTSGQPEAPHLGDLLAELRHLEVEFDELTIDWKKKFLAVETEPVVLQRVHLGPFSIRLFWNRLALSLSANAFDVVALEPNPAAGNDEVTHPHVKDRKLCSGDASLPLTRALEQGRLVDAFFLIRNVLGTYNAGSAHIPLEDWDGISCEGCGRMISPRDDYACLGCGCEHCSDCVSFCEICYSPWCHSCQPGGDDDDRCPRCRERQSGRSVSPTTPQPEEDLHESMAAT